MRFNKGLKVNWRINSTFHFVFLYLSFTFYWLMCTELRWLTGFKKKKTFAIYADKCLGNQTYLPLWVLHVTSQYIYLSETYFHNLRHLGHPAVRPAAVLLLPGKHWEREKSTHSKTRLTLHTYSEVSSPQFPPSPPLLNIWKWAGRCLCSSSSSCWWTWRQSRPPRTGGDSVWRSPRGERDITTPLLASHLGTDTELRGPDYDWRSYHFLITSARAVD